jgi:subtilisin family serine protease
MVIKKILMMAAVLCCTVSIEAQTSFQKTKMSSWLHQHYLQEQQAIKKNGGPRRVEGRPVKNYMLTLVKSDGEIEAIREQGGVVMQDFGNDICAAFLPIDRLGELEQNSHVLRMEANAPSELMNDTSAVILGVDKAWNQEHSSALPQAFTGKGVVAGVMDVGFDFTHPAFRNSDGTSRIKWFWDPVAPDATNDGLGMIYSTPAEVLAARFCTNADSENHGCHVMGSMAGCGLNGRYVGMAPEADIMGAHLPLGHFTDKFLKRISEYILSHREDGTIPGDEIIKLDLTSTFELVELYNIFKAADAAGEPCVVNWSFGTSPNFLHDNTLYEEVFNQLVGPGHIVVTSAGNSGHKKSYLKKEGNTELDQDVYYSGTSGQFSINLRTELEEPDFMFGLTFDGVENLLTITTDAIREAAERGKMLVHNIPEMKVFYSFYRGAYDKLVYRIQINPTDSFMNVIRINEDSVKMHGKLLVDAPAQVDMMGGQTNTTSVLFSTENLLNSRGCQMGTIGLPANLERIIAVGAMHQRTAFTNILNEQSTYKTLGSEEGHLTSFSSCGPTENGRIKPDVVAPGHNILSCLNSFYSNNHDTKATSEEVEPRTAYTAEAYGQTYAMWAMSGTSMACPIAAGVIALWLQAKPDLTPEDILGVIERTSHQPEPEFSGEDKNIYYGWGEIDAYAGLLDILDVTANIPELSQHQPAGIKFRLNGHALSVDGAEDGTPVTVYDLSGRPVHRATVADGLVQLPDLRGGVYAVQLGTKGSTLIRL